MFYKATQVKKINLYLINHIKKNTQFTNTLTWRNTLSIHGVLIKVGGIQMTGNLGKDWNSLITLPQTLPIEAIKPP